MFVNNVYEGDYDTVCNVCVIYSLAIAHWIVH